MPINREVTFQSGMMNSTFAQGTVGLNILIVTQLPATGSSKYIYGVQAVNQLTDNIPVLHLYVYFNNQWYAIADSRLTIYHNSYSQAEYVAQKAYWDLMNEISVAREVLNTLIAEEADEEDIAEAQATLDALVAQKSTKLSAWNAAKAAAETAENAGKAALEQARANIVPSED